LLNCKPGDLAYVRCLGEKSDNGKIVVVVRPARVGDICEDGTPIFRAATAGWFVRGTDLHLLRLNGSVTGGFSEVPIADASLRPIRDPGDDAQDESKAWLPPVPTQHKESA
jgi:hypothetical protein